ncbi:MAG: C-GCAxxG-C-C family protein [Peptococcaceae bacterium]|jgi:C_GCAxxG_C_C family probable redox protein|nr:C-GCAxxG-C-C family protein [Peptococcaceae bacterium]
MLSNAQILNGFKERMHCSQQVLMEWAEELGYDREEAARMAAPFGGGMFRGDTCGAVGGAMIAIGMKYGNSTPGDAKKDDAMQDKVKEFQEKFAARNGSTICRDLLGYDFAKPEERAAAFATGKVKEVCPKLVQDALEILDEIM